ncbi:MAG: response regulator [Desulfobacteraceae bacterium]|nr:response regulator [Desulfobacteraceae bacterium]
MGKLSVLILGFNKSQLLMLKNYILPLNAGIVHALSGDEGIAIAGQGRVDLIFSNMTLPDMDGIDLCRQLKSTLATQAPPVVLLGASETDRAVARGFEAGAAAYVEKKEAKFQLVEIARDLLAKHAFRREKLILVVDDSTSVRRMLMHGLQDEGFRVIGAENGKAALELFNREAPDLILLDICMPEMNGVELCERLNADSVFSTIPIMVMSTKSDMGNVKRMMQYGAVSYILKPFDLEQLILRLEKIFAYQFQIQAREKERLDTEHHLLVSGLASLANALEARDQYTLGHSERVGAIISGLVRLSGGTREEMARAGIGGKLHDIGKIGIRDHVLLKPGSLTNEEFEYIKQHPGMGANILKSIPRISDLIPIVESHHERMDGKGYPRGLKGSQIPLWARMAAVADTYDALTSSRPYRKGMAREKALQIIEEAKGSQLCPDCVALFFQWYGEEGQSFQADHERTAETMVSPPVQIPAL